jgi:hypothetical protein
MGTRPTSEGIVVNQLEGASGWLIIAHSSRFVASADHTECFQ